MSQTIRRVVTGHDGDGKAVVLSDARVGLPPIPGIDARGAVAWTTETVPADNLGDTEGSTREVGATIRSGSVFRITDFGPGFESPMHRTHSIDYAAVLSGELELELDGGAIVRLRPGDVVVQRGTNHLWRNPSPEQPCRIFVAMIEAVPLTVGGRALEATL